MSERTGQPQHISEAIARVVAATIAKQEERK